MKRLLLFIVLLVVSSVAVAEDEALPFHHVDVDVTDQASLQRGAKLFMNYCSGCHSLQYMRYSKLAEGLGLTTDQGGVDKELLMSNLVFTTAQVGDPITIAMPPEDAHQWFGVVPPDLTLEVRVRGATWIYNYLRSFYRDDKRPFGSNNLYYPDVAMPNVLEPLQGIQVPVYSDKEHKQIDYLQLTRSGEMTQLQFDSAMNDIVNFLAYVAEPSQDDRETLGYWVIAFLMVLLVLAVLLKKEYWKDVK